MDASIVLVAMAGFGIGAGVAFLVSVYAPNVVRMLRLYAFAGVILLPFALGLAGAEQMMHANWDSSDFVSGAWVYFFILPQPLGVLCVSMMKDFGRKLMAAAGGVLVFLPVYLMFAVSLTAANVMGHAL